MYNVINSATGEAKHTEIPKRSLILVLLLKLKIFSIAQYVQSSGYIIYHTVIHSGFELTGFLMWLMSSEWNNLSVVLNSGVCTLHITLLIGIQQMSFLLGQKNWTAGPFGCINLMFRSWFLIKAKLAMSKYQSFSYWQAWNEPDAISSIFKPLKDKLAIIIASDPLALETQFITISFPYRMNWGFFYIHLKFGELVYLG